MELRDNSYLKWRDMKIMRNKGLTFKNKYKYPPRIAGSNTDTKWNNEKYKFPDDNKSRDFIKELVTDESRTTSEEKNEVPNKQEESFQSIGVENSEVEEIQQTNIDESSYIEEISNNNETIIDGETDFGYTEENDSVSEEKN